MIIGIDKGHSTWDKSPCGAIGLLNESKENREVGDRVISKLQGLGHTVIDCSCNNANSPDAQLQAIVNKANGQRLDLFCSLHLNAGGGTGVEIYTTSTSSAKEIARRVLESYVNKTGFKSRGHKYAEYYVLRNVVAPAILLEMCFVDNKEDKKRWDDLSYDLIANSIVEGILNIKINYESEEEEVAIKDIFVESYYLDNNVDVRAEVNRGIIGAKEHYDKYGKAEGRKPNCGIPKGWSEAGYLMNNPDVDVNVSSGEGYRNGLEHYLLNGYREGRTWEYRHTCKIEEEDKELGEKFYRVCTGSFKQIENARAEKETLKNKGINNAFVVEYYKN